MELKTDIQLISEERRYEFMFHDTGMHKDIATLSLFNDKSVFFKIVHRSASEDYPLYSKAFKSLQAFEAEPIYGINKSILKLLRQKPGWDEGTYADNK